MTEPLPGRPQPSDDTRLLLIRQRPVALHVGQDEHSAFPGLTDLPDGRTRLMWRQGPHHVDGRIGDLVEAYSSDGGETYQDLSVWRTGGDLRDPSPAVFPGPDGQPVESVTWFPGSNANPAMGAYASINGGPAVRFDGGLPYAATCAPLVRLPDGRIGGAFYGRKPGETIDTAWMAWSSDGGATWTTNRIANGIGVGIAHNEPTLLVDDGLTHMFFRWGQYDGIGMCSSPDSGTSGWDPSRKILSNATGRPSVVRADDGTLIMVYRERPTGHARIAYSADRGQRWKDGGVLMRSLGGLGTTYAAMVSRGTRRVHGVLGMEEGSSARSRLYRFELVTAG